MTDASSRSSRDLELEALVGRTIAGKYAVLRLLGKGGMGAVYEAENVAIGKKVALKFVDREFAKDEQVVGRFAREARAASSIESAHIVTVFDAGMDEGRPYLVMELLRGEDVGIRLRRVGTLPVGDALHIIAQVLRGLARAHDAGIVHRDLKPDNVFLIRSDGDPIFAKIVDFGVSKIHKAQSGTSPLALTGKGTVLGTPLYMSPEQAQAAEDLDGRADLYSVGAILFECLAGRPPHTGASYEQIILSICMTDAPPLASLATDVPPAVSAFVAKALARDRTARFQSANDMLAALHAIAPAERVRVPIDPSVGATLLSGSDVAAPLAPAGPPTGISWSRGSSSKPHASAATPMPTKAAPSRLAVPLTAFGATLAGVLVTSWIVSSLRKEPAAPPPLLTRSTATLAPSAPAPFAPVSASSAPDPSAMPASSAAQAAPADPSPAPPPRTRAIPLQTRPTQVRAPTAPPKVTPAPAAQPKKPLDISRELPD